MSDYEACYFFNPDKQESPVSRPSKRRKTGKVQGRPHDTLDAPFVSLLRGTEHSRSVASRTSCFSNSWQHKESIIKETIGLTNNNTVDEIVSFVLAQNVEDFKRKLPTGLIICEPDNVGSLQFKDVAERASLTECNILVELTSGECPNLKTTLKYINQRATSQNANHIDSKHERNLNYDLEILHRYTHHNSVGKVMIVFQDSESFEENLLAELVEVFSSWKNRIPFVLFFNIATSAELFQSKLPRETIRYLAGSEFRVKRVKTDIIFHIVNHENSTLYLGPALSRMILQRQCDFIQSPTTLVRTFKYAYLTHFFADPLSILLCDDPREVPLQKEHYEAVRNLPSFRRYVRKLMNKRRFDAVRDLLDDDESLNDAMMDEIVKSRKAIRGILSGLKVLHSLQECSFNKLNVSWSEFYIQAFSGALLDSALYSDILEPLKKTTSDTLSEVLSMFATEPLLPPDLIADLAAIKSDLEDMKILLGDGARPLRSVYDIQHSTLRTTVVAQKVSLSKNSSKLSPQDTAFTEIIDRIHEALTAFLRTVLIDPSDLFLHELLIYDAKTPYREAFTFKPRSAIERALTSPHDYLGCECCSSGENVGLEASHPATAILYQLYLESGSVINIADLWEAFWTIVGNEGEEEEREWTLALFSRAMAELKYLGMIKSSRKKADHLQKLTWQGL